VIDTFDDDLENLGAASKDRDLTDWKPLDWNGNVSLRAVIEQANYNRANSQLWATAPIYVTFDPSIDAEETILARALDTISANIVFIGRGDDLTGIAGHSTGGVGSTQGIFRFASGSTSAILGMTLELGSNTDPGGAVSVATGASVFLDSVWIQDCEAKSGGAIFSNGYAATINSTIYGNHAGDVAASGGGVHVNGGFFISSESAIQNNTGLSKGGGIAINTSGTAFIYSTDIVGNSGQSAGGIYLSGGNRLVILDGLFLGNSSTGLGGGVLIEGRASIRNTGFDWNSAATTGGAIIFQSGTLTLKGCEFGDDNTATNGPKMAKPKGAILYAEPGDNINFDPATDIFVTP
jgi:hypothetical protein